MSGVSEPRCANPECGHVCEKHGGGNRCWAVVPLGSLCYCEAWQEPSVPRTANEVPTSANVAARTPALPAGWHRATEAEAIAALAAHMPVRGPYARVVPATLVDLLTEDGWMLVRVEDRGLWDV